MDDSKPLGKVVGYVAGVILIAIGIAVLLSGLLSMAAYITTATSMTVGGALPVVDNSTVFVIITVVPTKITINPTYTKFKIAVVPVSSLPPLSNNKFYASSPQLFVYQLNVSNIRYVNFTGDYTNITMTLEPGSALLIWPYRVVVPYLSYDYEISSRKQSTLNLTSLFPLTPLLIIDVALLYGGVVFIRWSRK